MKLIDNFLEDDLFRHVQNILLYEVPYKYNHKSSPKIEGNIFFMSYLNIEDPILKFISKKIINSSDVEKLTGCYANMQFNGMDGDWHTDPGKFTALLMLSETLEKESGQFQIKNPKTKIDFVSNRLVIFKANLKHRGLAPKELNTPRVTLVFKSANK